MPPETSEDSASKKTARTAAKVPASTSNSSPPRLKSPEAEFLGTLLNGQSSEWEGAAPADGADSGGEIKREVIERFGKRREIVTLEGEITKDFVLFSEFPFATLQDGRGKAGAIQAANRFEQEWEVFDPETNRTLTARWEVVGDEAYGLPTAQDEELYLVLMQIALEQNFPEKVGFSRHDLIHRLGWKKNAERYEDIALAFRRLSGVRIYAENVMRSNGARGGTHTFGTSGSSLIGAYFLENETPGRKKRAPGAVSSPAGSFFCWSPPLQELLREGQIRTINLKFLLSLHRPLSRRLARYLSRKAYDRKESFEIGLGLLSSRHLGMTPTPYESVYRQRLEEVHTELIERSFLTRVTFSEMKTRKGQKVRYEFGAKAFETGEDAGATPLLPLEAPLSPVSPAPPKKPATKRQKAAPVPQIAPEEPSPDEAAQLLTEKMEKLGVSGAVARELLEKFGAGAVEAQLLYLSDREPRDAPATFVKAVREDWAPPGAYAARIEAQNRENARQNAAQDAQNRAEQQAQAEQSARDREAAQNAQLDELWQKLDEPLREVLEREAVEKLGVLGRTGRAQAALTAMRRAVLRERLEELQNQAQND